MPLVNSSGRPARGNKGAETRSRVLVEASRLFAIHGYRGTTTRQIAEAAGVTQPAIFFHFASKKALVEELCDIVLAQPVAQLKRMIADHGSPAAKLLALLLAEMRLRHRSPFDPRFQIMTRRGTDPDLTVQDELAAEYDRLVGVLIEEAQESGEFVEADPWPAFAAALGPIAVVLVAGGIPPDQEMDAASIIVIRGMLKDPDALERIRTEAEGLVEMYWPAADPRLDERCD